MNKTCSLLLVSALLVLGLTACGGAGRQNGNLTDDGTATTGQSSAGNDGPADNYGRGDSLIEDAGEAVGNGARDVKNGVERALTGNTANGTTANTARAGTAANTANGTLRTTRTATGADYDQMLRNARVHDRDGRLWDLENAVTPGGTF